MGSILFSLSAFGFLGFTMLCPLLAWSGYGLTRYTHKKKHSSPGTSVPKLINIIIPAHNEAGSIAATLTSIHRSIEVFRSGYVALPPPAVQIQLGADGCTDQTISISRTFPLVTVFEFAGQSGKWSILKALSVNSAADWIIYVDAGTVWPEGFLTKVVQRMSDRRDVIAIAPSYKPLNGSFLHRMVWEVEKAVKQLEAFSGGPVTVHGATVCYKTDPLKQALRYLGDTPWLNDDVVIPLLLRSLYPDGVILYPVGEVGDVDGKEKRVMYRRRNRLLIGNLQWVVALLPYCFSLNPVSGILALRRVFRIFWAYWVILMVLGAAVMFHAVLPILLGFGLLLGMFGTVRELAGAAFVSFMAPFRIMRLDDRLQGVWK